MTNYYFTKAEFYSNEENDKINSLCSLYEKNQIKKIPEDMEVIMNQILADIDKQEIDKKILEKFFENPEEVVIRRLNLLRIVFYIFDPRLAYDRLKIILYSINRDIEVLTHIKDSLSIFHKNKYEREIKELTSYITILEQIRIKEYNDDRIIDSIEKLKNLGPIAKQVDLVKDFLFFKVIYEKTQGENQEIRFEKANEKLMEIKELFEKDEKLDINEIYKQNKEIFDEIKNMLKNKEKESEEFFKEFGQYLNIGGKKELMDEIILLFK